MDEFTRIRKMTGQLKTVRKNEGHRQQKKEHGKPELVVGIGDDAAVVSWATDDEMVVSCDTFIETIHFHHWTMNDEAIGYKALAANVSDIVAMGGIPLYALVSIASSKRHTIRQLERIYRGINQCASLYGIQIIGGDTVSSPRHLMITITLFGRVMRNRALLRSGAKPHDAVFITGFPGLASAGLQALLEQKKAYPNANKMIEPLRTLANAHQRPRPSVEAGRLLIASHACHALNDLSDGIASEAHEISASSGYALTLNESSFPIAQELLEYTRHFSSRHPLDFALYGGEDFHLMGTIAPHTVDEISNQFAQHGLPFFIIGQVCDERTNEGKVYWESEQGVTMLQKKGYDHFRS